MGLRDEPWGTPQMMFLDSKVNCDSRTLWVLPVRKEVIDPLEGVSLDSDVVKSFDGVWWDTVLNTAEWLRKIKAAVSPQWRRVLMLLVTAIRAVSVLWLVLSMDWEMSRRLLFSRCSVSWGLLVFSSTLVGKGSREMGP